MPIPLHAIDDTDQLSGLGTAGYLRVEAESGGAGYLAALFQVTLRGEPVEFTWNRVVVPSTFLWRPGDLRLAALRLLVASLFDVCPSVPALILYQEGLIPDELFGQDAIRVDIPLGRVTIDGGEPSVIWLSTAPEPTSDAGRLAVELARRGLLLEPFERASEGLREVQDDG